MANRERKKAIKVFLSDDERYILEEKVKMSDAPTISSFIRQMIIYGFVYEINYDGLNEYCRQLGKIGNNINQIVRLCNKTGSIYSEDIEGLKLQMEKVWETQTAMLKKQPLANHCTYED